MEYLTPEQIKELLEQFGHAIDSSKEENTEHYARMAADNIKFILQMDVQEILSGATHKVNNYRGLISTIIPEESAFPRTSNITTGEQLLIHICYSLMRELKDILVWNAFHQDDKEFRDWILREVFDVDIRVESEVIEEGFQVTNSDEAEDDSEEDTDEL